MADRTKSERLLTFLLLPAIVIAVAALVGVMFRSSFQLERLREQSVVEATLALANEKADRLDKRIIEQDNAVASLVDFRDREHFGTGWLKVAPIQTPTVTAVVVVDMGTPDRDVVAFATLSPGPEADRIRRLLIHVMLPEMRLDPPREELRHLHKSYREQSLLVSYWQRLHGTRPYLVAAWHDVPRIVHGLFPKLYSETDQQSRVNVVDSEGLIVWGPPLRAGGPTLGRQFETTLYKWRLNVAMTSADEIAAAVARRRVQEMVLVGLSGLVVIAGLIVVLVAAERERRLSALKSDFVANVSHELKTPLSLVRMFGELLLSGRVASDDKRRESLQIIVTESERLTALTEHVLDFAKFERGKSAFDFHEGDVGQAVVRAVDIYKYRAEREGVEVDVSIDPHLPPVMFDERSLELLLMNLLDNALKYAKDGKKVSVDVRAGASDIAIRVSDKGPGIPPHERRRIFERFVRGSAGTEKQIRGSGIGLALVKHIAESHGGRAWVESEPGQGSTFVTTIPVAKR